LKDLIELDLKWNLYKRDDLCYAVTNNYGRDENGKYKLLNTTLLHRFVLRDKYTEGKHIDHRNHNGLDCRRENLRIIEVSENSQYRSRKNKNNKSGYRNVFWNSRDEMWHVCLQVNKKHKRLGRFSDVHEAGNFAEKMRQKYYGEFAGKS